MRRLGAAGKRGVERPTRDGAGDGGGAHRGALGGSVREGRPPVALVSRKICNGGGCRVLQRTVLWLTGLHNLT